MHLLAGIGDLQVHKWFDNFEISPLKYCLKHRLLAYAFAKHSQQSENHVLELESEATIKSKIHISYNNTDAKVLYINTNSHDDALGNNGV